MRKFRLLSLLLLAIAFITVNCTKEGPEGPAGATGAQGPAGVAGATGATGAAGSQGPAGTANVIYSAWFTPAANGNWVDTTINLVTLQKKFNKSAPGVTQAILNSGVVLSFVKLFPDGVGGATTSVRTIPYTNAGEATQLMAIHYVGSVTFAHISIANPGVTVNAFSNSLEFRYVIIPGGVPGGRSSGLGGTNYSAAELRAMSYSQICSLFNISQ